MSLADRREPGDGFATEGDRKKRLGQYFTGLRLARLLSSLADARKARTIIDPMLGSGDMLLGCLAHGASPTTIAGVEIDPIAADACRSRLYDTVTDWTTEATFLVRDSFDPETIAALPVPSWDLVITNPPYVRYQSTARGVMGRMRLPSSLHIRQGLIGCIERAEALDDEDRDVLRALAAGYSGLADIAVPSWMLCAALVRPGGTLAMVVPEAWLSRDYAAPVQYMLRRMFTVDYVVEDADAVWFADALVKTTLVVARRVSRRSTAFAPESDEGFVHASIAGEAVDDRSVVGSAYPRAGDPDMAFVRLVRAAKRSRADVQEGAIRTRWVAADDTAQELLRHARSRRWLVAIEPEARARYEHSPHSVSVAVPRSVRDVIGAGTSDVMSLDEYGWTVGQGLRTGCNQFFYVSAEEDGETCDGNVTVRTSELFGKRTIEVEPALLHRVVRRQSDVRSDFAVSPTSLRGRVLALEGVVHPDDTAQAARLGYRDIVEAAYEPMEAGLAQYVARAARTSLVTTGDTPRCLPELSAVETNIRRYDRRRPDIPPRFWYQLPPMTPRHRPEVFLARVNGVHPRAILNSDRQAVVDANFSTLWPTTGTALDGYAMLAVLNSAWGVASMELIGTVLGGGALKLEATQLRRLALPHLTRRALGRLSSLGRTLAVLSAPEATSCIAAIDGAILHEVMGRRAAGETTAALRRVAAARLQARTR